ncbi:hypothetical protein [Aliterella atlantica]|uniref:Glycosyl hydrolase n=1 Tax=Aliterella atlantica CENA595 TaxID=1618023 RepID=A0A0D8ZW70_9CYAN|nr:hypothetical protein [Aliterella atlantica]KJH72669.1 hypothetical protein UH38_06020 [Aliterella atlantica CENA595]
MMRSPNLKLLLLLTLLLNTFGCFAEAPTNSKPPTPPKPASKTTPAKAAKSAYSFVDSICLNTHWSYGDTPYGQKYDAVRQKLVALGVRHIRDGGASPDVIRKMRQLARQGIKTTYIMNPNVGVAPNSSYWVTEPGYKVVDFVKKVGTNTIDAVEISNEIDLNFQKYYWRKGDKEKLNDDPNSSRYWVPYIRSLTKDTYKALKSDRATAKVKVIGPSLGRTYNYENKSPLGDLSADVDWGNFHPYPSGGNPFNNPFQYNTIEKYYWHSNFPSVNLDNHPYAFDVYAPPFGRKPMAATETGYFTTKGKNGISEKVHGKYIPRLFLEYFRNGVTRTCSYELVDEWSDRGNSEGNYGILRNNLTPKPAYTALKNIISVLKDPQGARIVPRAVNYKLTFKAPPKYDRTEYVHDLLLQKRDGSFYLVLWHEISNGDRSRTPVREINPPPIPTQVNLVTPIRSATIYTLNDVGNMATKAAPIRNNRISLNVTDKATIIKLVPRK